MRPFLHSVVLFLGFCYSTVHAERPNILFCISDDQSYQHTGANGDPVIKTPTFDRVANEGQAREVTRDVDARAVEGLQVVVEAREVGGGLLVAALIKLCTDAVSIVGAELKLKLAVGKAWLLGGILAAPALVGVGFIVGLNIAILIFIGGAINWWIAIPVYVSYNDLPLDPGAQNVAWGVWSANTTVTGYIPCE